MTIGSINHEITQIEKRLEQLRQDWKKASPPKKKFIEGLAKLHKEKLAKLNGELTKLT